MPAPSKASASTKEKDRRKSTTAATAAAKNSVVVTLRLSPDRLRGLIDPSSIKEESPVKESPATSTTLPNEAAAVASNGDNASPSTPGTPAPSGTPSQVPMGPPSEAPKKKGVKRSAAAANGNDPSAKVRGKPGPKKKPRLDDGTIDPNGRPNGGSYHKLGPKANQGAINAGLRALDRSGAPCRKWSRGGFRVKSFTGVVWEVSRWTAPPKPKPEAASTEESAVSAEGSNKENKEGSQMKSENSNSNIEGEQRSVPPSVHASSPAPMAIAATS
ncbi:INO80 complex, subunit Ies4 [Biscogniauxia marginata]|nr:INO80 complex, subunit Ies4 [Biscogniauxia marginata]